MYSEEELIEEIQRVSEEEIDKETVSKADMDEYGDHAASTYRRRFESWNEAKRIAGLPINPCTRDEEIIEEELISEEELKEELIRISEKDFEGEAPKFHEWVENENKKYSTSPYIREFGSWTDALKESGFEPHILKLSDEELLQKLRDLASEYGVVTQAILKEDEEVEVTNGIFVQRFGGWNDALEEAGLERNCTTLHNPSGDDHPRWRGGVDSYYGDSWSGSKAMVRDRDGLTCRVCGGSNILDWDPDVHHIKPVREWDVEEEHLEMNDPSNLISLCRECHKSLEGKWQDASPDEFARKGKDFLDIEEEKPTERSLFDY